MFLSQHIFFIILLGKYILKYILTTYCCKALAGVATEISFRGLCHLKSKLYSVLRAKLKGGFAMLLADLLLNSNLNKRGFFSEIDHGYKQL